jgi:hypothetical protein
MYHKPPVAKEQGPTHRGILRGVRLPSSRLALDRGAQASARNTLRQNAEGVPPMDRYLTRGCPRCNGHVGIILREPGQNTQLQAVNDHCVRCGSRFAWILIRGKRSLRSRPAPARLAA